MAHRRKQPDTISQIATIGPLMYVAFRLLTGDWTTAAFFAIVFAAVLAFYLLVVMRSTPVNPPAPSDDPPEISN